MFPNFYQRIQYAKTQSDAITKANGTYVPKEKRKKQEEKGTSSSPFSHFRFFSYDIKSVLVLKTLSICIHVAIVMRKLQPELILLVFFDSWKEAPWATSRPTNCTTPFCLSTTVWCTSTCELFYPFFVMIQRLRVWEDEQSFTEMVLKIVASECCRFPCSFDVW